MSEASERLRQAIAQHRQGDHEAAEAGYREHLRQFPNDPSALHFLGLLRTHQGRNPAAIELMGLALEADPSYVDAWSNLGIAYFQERDFERAEVCCRKALEIAPEFANAWGNLGMILRAKDAVEGALSAWGRALELEPGMRNVAIPYGHLLYRLNRIDEALAFYHRWQSACPQDPVPQHMLAAMGGAERPARASDGYVRATFDDFAESFDQNLGDLKYAAPQLLYAAVASSMAPGAAELQVLDLGCGTGLCGPLLRPIARHLVGVDLSPKMLAKAAGRGVYDQLNCAELTRWLASCSQRFDLVVAADVLCYFGDLAVVLAHVRSVLGPAGRFACSLEALTDGEPRQGFALRPHGRYQHDRGYVTDVLGAAGLRLTSLSEGVLRYERQDAVTGHLAVAVRADVQAQ